MTNTIEWLENIGADASLRHAPELELKRMLRQSRASCALQRAAMTGNASAIRNALGAGHNQVVHAPPSPGPSPSPPPPPAPTSH